MITLKCKPTGRFTGVNYGIIQRINEKVGQGTVL